MTTTAAAHRIRWAAAVVVLRDLLRRLRLAARVTADR